jgi:hypothetical protein
MWPFPGRDSAQKETIASPLATASSQHKGECKFRIEIALRLFEVDPKIS